MKRGTIRILSLLLMAFELQLNGQGTFIWNNRSAPTRLYTIDGPLAEPGIWGQMFVGVTPDDLLPIGVPMNHYGEGLILSPGNVSVSWIPCDTYGYVQMVAWDGELWGTVFENVPETQLGKTDIARTPFTCLPFPVYSPQFTQPAVVPPVPEPSVLALGVLGIAGAVLIRRRKR